ncbi:MAG: hypothetical protein BMS9Abin34_296 [Patescibacteria group bacterium]|nr:MAG: hypothetical protein BMS9Abin34_296 [Patescibacteria group bacterium]
MSWYIFLVISHIIGTVLGAGGATMSDFIFFKSIEDGKINRTEFGFLKMASAVVWAGFIILVFSGFGFLILYRVVAPELGLLYDPKLWAKLSVVGVILLNGLVMHWKVFPLLKSRVDKPLTSSEFINRSPIVFTTGAISIISWYTALILGGWRGLDLPYSTIIGAYLLAISGGIVVANIFGRYLIEKMRSKNR